MSASAARRSSSFRSATAVAAARAELLERFPQACALLAELESPATCREASLRDVPSEIIEGTALRREQAQEHAAAASPRAAPARCEYYSHNDSEGMICSVEELALEHFAEPSDGEAGWAGVHAEGGLVRALFALFMYEAIFNAAVPDVFQTSFQSAPLDLAHSRGLFVRNRATQVEQLLRGVLDSSPAQLGRRAREQWEAHCGVSVAGINWRCEQLTRERLACAAACMGPVLLEAVLRRLALDYAHWGGGVPDLFIYRIRDAQGAPLVPVDQRRHGGNRPVRGDHPALEFDERWSYQGRFVEVKSLNDRLSDKQIAWIAFLNESRAGAASVLKVEPARRQAKRARRVPVVPVLSVLPVAQPQVQLLS